MRMKYTVLTFIFTLLLLGCTQSNYNGVSKIENLIDNDADSALALLKDIDVKNLSKSENAKYRLLLSNTYDRLGINVDSDSIVAPALDYYKKIGAKREMAEAYFWLAQTMKNRADRKGATESYLEALSLLDKQTTDTTQLKLIAITYYNLATLYFEQSYYKEAEEYYNQSIEFFNQFDEKNALLTKLMIASVIIAEGDQANGVKVLDELRDSTTDIELRTWLDMIIIKSAVITDLDIYPLDKLLKMRDSLDYNTVVQLSASGGNHEWSESPQFLYNTISAFLYYRNGESKRAYEYIKNGIKQISTTTTLNVGYYKSAAEIAKVAGDLDAALVYEQMYSQKSDSLHSAMREHQVKQVEMEFSLKSSNELRVTQMRYRLYIWILLFILLLGATLWAIKSYRIRLRKQNEQIAEYLTLIENYKNTTNSFTEQLRESDSKESVIKKYLGSRKDMVQQIAATYYTYGEGSRFAEKMRDLALSDQMLADIVEITDIYRDGNVSRLKSEFPGWTKKNYNFAALIIAGFSPQEISVMLGMTLGGVYTLKSKLKRKILSVTNGCESEFLSYFS